MRIRRNRPLPSGPINREGKYETWLKKLNVEDCVEDCTYAETQGLRHAAIKLGVKVTQRHEGNGVYTVWRIS